MLIFLPISIYWCSSLVFLIFMNKSAEKKQNKNFFECMANIAILFSEFIKKNLLRIFVSNLLTIISLIFLFIKEKVKNYKFIFIVFIFIIITEFFFILY